MEIAKQIIHYLLFIGETVTLNQVVDALDIDVTEIANHLPEVKSLLLDLNLNLIQHNNLIGITIDKRLSQKFSQKENKELVKPLSDSALQTLAVIIYKQGASKAEIDFVRGVDSGRSLKTLTLRGLIERKDMKNKKVYHATLDTMLYMGIDSLDEVPNFIDINTNLKALLDQE